MLEIASARIGVNVSPEEVQNLPVNGRNFANLMTLATGATSDGNGGWASVRFNGKSNQQNYLNYDGVDGTYVWDASPGYLNATGSQFRLQTSMESVAEFRVNSGLAPAESGLGSGGNITVVSKSGSNAFRGSVFDYVRDDALDAASKYDDVEAGALASTSSAGRSVARQAEQDVLLRQLSRGCDRRPGSASPRPCRATKRGGEFWPVSRSDPAAGQSAERTQAVAPLLNGFPQAARRRPRTRCSRWRRTRPKRRRRRTRCRCGSTIASRTPSRSTSAISSARATSTRRIAPSRRAAYARSRSHRTWSSTISRVIGGSLVNEVKVGYNSPQTSAIAFGATPGYDPVGVSLSGTVTSSSIDARGTTGIARSGLLIRASSASSTTGSIFTPNSLSFSDALTWTRGAHTIKFGGEYRRIRGDFQFLGSTEITYNSVNDFIDNRPAAVQVALDSPVFTPQQYYLIGFAQDSWRAGDKLTLELGLRYDFYSVVKRSRRPREAVLRRGQRVRHRPGQLLRSGQEQLRARVCRRRTSSTSKTVVRGGFGLFYGPGQFEDRIQPIENYIERRRAQTADVPNNGLAYPFTGINLGNLLSIRGYTHDRPDEYNVQYGAACRASCPATSTSPSATRAARARTCSSAASATRSTSHTRSAARPDGRPGRLQDVGLPRRTGDQRPADHGLRLCHLQRAADERHAPLPRRLHRRPAVSVLAEQGDDAGVERGGDDAEHVRLRDRVRHQPAGHSAHVQRLARLPDPGRRAAEGRLARRRHRQRAQRRADQRRHQPARQRDGERRHRRRTFPAATAAARSGPTWCPAWIRICKDGVRWLNPAAFTTPQPGTFGNLPRNFLRGPEFWQVDLMFSKDLRFCNTQSLQVRVEVFNIANRSELREPGRDAAERHAGRAVHRRAGRHVRLHARTAQPHRRTRHRAADADFAALLVLVSS